ncbi:hypothetical protein ACLB2K_007522 [Fragaria x ananassa]
MEPLAGAVDKSASLSHRLQVTPVSSAKGTDEAAASVPQMTHYPKKLDPERAPGVSQAYGVQTSSSGSEATATSRNEGRPPASMKGAPPAPSPEDSHAWLSYGPETSFEGC